MPSQHFERNNKRFRHQVAVDCSVKDMDRAIIRSREEQRVRSRELKGSNGFRVVAQCLVRSVRQVEVVPDYSFVIRSDDDVVACITISIWTSHTNNAYQEDERPCSKSI